MDTTYVVTITRRLNPSSWESIQHYLRLMAWRDQPHGMSQEEYEQEQEAYELCYTEGYWRFILHPAQKRKNKLERLIRLAPPVKKRVYQEFYELFKAGGWFD